jgi:nicotinate-nucleotide adenylyltransferase
MARIGILGGTFNPVHLGHLILAQDALERFELDRVFFVPCAQSPHKTAEPPIAAAHRAAMLEAALEGDPRMEVSRAEIERGGVSYTIDTVEDFARRFPGAEICFIIGADTLAELHRWKDIGRLLERCAFVTLARPGFDVDAIAPESLRLPPPWPERLLARVAAGHAVDISSTDVRMRLAEGLRVRYLVPDAVEMYIREHHLYEC